jgi:hypothetical protein
MAAAAIAAELNIAGVPMDHTAWLPAVRARRTSSPQVPAVKPIPAASPRRATDPSESA